MKFGLTQTFTCSYLPDEQERLLVFAADSNPSEQEYALLLHNGFRRSGEQIYRPHCDNCKACQSLRVLVDLFRPTSSQKRIGNRNKDLRVEFSDSEKDSYYPLYARYINQRHMDGSMYPANRQQYESFIRCQWLNSLFIECYENDELIGVAVTDVMDNALSALYTFFEPSADKRSLGTFAILQQIKAAQELGKPYLYLGYQVDECTKMNYKEKFMPHERFMGDKWQVFAKKSG